MPRHSCCEVRIMQLHDILLLRTSASLHKNTMDLYEYVETLIVDDEKYYIFLDEIQMVEKFERV